jgi:hypothetical protein
MAYSKKPIHLHETFQETEWRLKQEAKELLKKIKDARYINVPRK